MTFLLSWNTKQGMDPFFWLFTNFVLIGFKLLYLKDEMKQKPAS